MPTNSFPVAKTRLIVLIVIVIAVVAAAGLTRERWYPLVFGSKQESVLDKLEQHVRQKTEDDGHNHGAHGDGKVVALSKRGLKNIGYESFVVEPTTYEKTLTLPAIIVERPGRSQLHVTAPLTGVVAKIHAVTGEAIEPRQLMFEVQLTHEELVAAQRDYLRTVENLDVVNREIKRLKSLGEGVVAGRRVLAQEYKKQKLEASLHAESQAMLLHGLTGEQVDEIRKTRRLFQEIKIRAPQHNHRHGGCTGDHPFQIQELAVSQGQQIEAGGNLATLGDHCELLLEAIAFEDDAPQIRAAAQAGRKMRARQLGGASDVSNVTDLEVLYVADQIDAESRAFKIYLRLPNQLALDSRSPTGQRYVEWVYKPGQRMQLHVPVETWEDQMVVPSAAVVDEGAEAYVYHLHGDHFDQVAVHVLHRDQDLVVIANDGALQSGAVIAGSGAYQIYLSLKNQSGGGTDPHAGHNH